MADLLPSSPDTAGAVDEQPWVLGLDSDEAEAVLGSLSSDTARGILAALHEEPASPAAVADRVDTSLQNAQYHLERLEGAGVIQVADTVYSEKGREMDVYAPSSNALVVVAGREEETTGLKAALSRLLGGVGVLGVAAVALDRLSGRSVFLGGQGGSPDGGDVDLATNESVDGGAGDAGDAGSQATETAAEATRTPAVTDTPEPTPTAAEATRTVTEAAAESTRAATETVAADAGTGLDLLGAFASPSPGLLFFLGGVTALLLWFGYWVATR